MKAAIKNTMHTPTVIPTEIQIDRKAFTNWNLECILDESKTLCRSSGSSGRQNRPRVVSSGLEG